MNSDTPSVAIIGAGIIGLSCAWELTKRGADVSIIEGRWPPRGASWAAAGMLAPAYEARAEDGIHPRLFELCMDSAEMWPAFASELEAESGIMIGFQTGPSLAVASTKLAQTQIAELATHLVDQGLPNVSLQKEELQEFAPELSQSLFGGVLLGSDGQVDNRRVVNALSKVVVDAGAKITQHHTSAVIRLLSKGWQSSHVYPAKGVLLSLSPVSGAPRHVIREGSRYLVPKTDRIIIGATEEHGRSDDEINNDDIAELRDWACAIAPALASANILETWSGIRPMTMDRAPMFGLLGDDYIAAGHYRNGILLAPVTAKIMADMIMDSRVNELTATFSPDRFVTATP